MIEAFDLEYTVLRQIWYTNSNEIDYEINHKGKPEKDIIISKKSLASFIGKLIEQPEKNVRESLGINESNS